MSDIQELLKELKRRQDAARSDVIQAGQNVLGESQRWSDDFSAARRDYVETRSKFMLLSAGIIGGVVPLLATVGPALDVAVWHLKAAAVALLGQMIVGGGAQFWRRFVQVEAIGHKHRLTSAKLAFAVATEAERHGLRDVPNLPKSALEEQQKVTKAMTEFEAFVHDFHRTSSIEDALFYGLFVIGIVNLMLAFL